MTRRLGVGDHSEGLSFYADSTTCRLLALDACELCEARGYLLSRELILHEHPLYQVLPLPSIRPVRKPRPKFDRERQRDSTPMSLGEILRQARRRAGPLRGGPEQPEASKPSIK
jgi:hypothetical protein